MPPVGTQMLAVSEMTAASFVFPEVVHKTSFDEPINHYMVHIEKKAAYLKKLVDDLYMFF